MSKNHTDYNVYTPALISELKKLTTGVPRAEGVKRLMRRLKISDRNARRVFVKYVESGSIFSDITPDSQKAFDKAMANPKNRITSFQSNIRAFDQIVNAVAESPRPIRRLLLDIETSPNIVLAWRAGFKLTITPESIIKERAIIMVGYKWSDEKDAHVLVWDKNQDDKALIAALIPIMAQADEIIFHNGSRFDLPWIRTRALFHGLPPIPDVTERDTLKWARSKFYFNSNKLDYIAKYLGIGGKLKTEFGLWKDVVLNKDTAALKRMAEYCANDVLLLEKVWARLYDLIAPKTHVGVLAGSDKWVCPRTGSTDVYVSKTRVSAAGTISYQMRSRATGSYFSISARAHEAYLSAKA